MAAMTKELRSAQLCLTFTVSESLARQSKGLLLPQQSQLVPLGNYRSMKINDCITRAIQLIHTGGMASSHPIADSGAGERSLTSLVSDWQFFNQISPGFTTL